MRRHRARALDVSLSHAFDFAVPGLAPTHLYASTGQRSPNKPLSRPALVPSEKLVFSFLGIFKERDSLWSYLKTSWLRSSARYLT